MQPRPLFKGQVTVAKNNCSQGGDRGKGEEGEGREKALLDNEVSTQQESAKRDQRRPFQEGLFPPRPETAFTWHASLICYLPFPGNIQVCNS